MNKWDERYKTGEGLRWWPNEEMVRFLGKTYGDMRTIPCKGMEAMEIGCGTGCNLIALTAYGFFAHGCDASDSAVTLAQEHLNEWAPSKARYGVRQLTMPSGQLWKESSLDLVVDCQTTQHLSWLERVDVYREVIRVLKSDGKFWSMCWAGSPSAAHAIYAGRYPELDFVTVGEWMQVLMESGLKPVSVPYRVERSYPQHHGIHGEWLVAEAVKL